MVEISTKTKKNLDKLIESILLQSEILDLKTDFESKATGIVLESKIDVGRGAVATVVVTSGTIKKGDFFVSGLKWGKVRALINDQGLSINEADPSTPIAEAQDGSLIMFLTTQPLPHPASIKLKFFNSFVANAIISLTEEEWFFSIPSSFPILAHSPKTSVAFRILFIIDRRLKLQVFRNMS